MDNLLHDEMNSLERVAMGIKAERDQLRSVLKDLLEQVESLDGYQVTRDLDRYKAEACFDDAMARAREALSGS